MKISGHLLVNNSNYFSSIFDKGINLSSIDLNNFIKEINAHL
jgi:hypothetical protein